jgi:hypothetical protein
MSHIEKNCSFNFLNEMKKWFWGGFLMQSKDHAKPSSYFLVGASDDEISMVHCN